MKTVFNRQARASRLRQRGLTLIELMVAMAISLVIVLAAVASLTVARRGFSTVDAASQLRDNGRYAADLIQRLGVQAGYKDIYYASRGCSVDPTACAPDPDVRGVDNAIPSSSDPINDSTARASGSVGYGSDILILRYQAAETIPGSGDSDNTMIDCMGVPSAAPAVNRADRMVSVLYVGVGVTGEPALMCYRQTTAGGFDNQPVIEGVESFQVLYGVSGVNPNNAPTAASTASAAAAADRVPDRYLPASALNIGLPNPPNPVGTAANWRRVRSIRIGMVLRGPPGSAQDRLEQTLYPLGPGKASAIDAEGSAFSSSGDTGTIFTTPKDGRLRRVVTFTIHLRNFQEL